MKKDSSRKNDDTPSVANYRCQKSIPLYILYTVNTIRLDEIKLFKTTKLKLANFLL